jgi:hypothetical protein
VVKPFSRDNGIAASEEFRRRSFQIILGPMAVNLSARRLKPVILETSRITPEALSTTNL